MTAAHAALAMTFLLEPCALFAVWNWRRRSRSPGWLLIGGTITLEMLATLAMASEPMPARSLLAVGGMYLITALAWSWSVEDLRPTNWTPGEIFIAVLGIAMVLMAGASYVAPTVAPLPRPQLFAAV